MESGSGVVGQELNHCGEWRMKIKQMWNQLRYCLLVLVVRVENWDLGKGKRGYWGWGLWVECRGHQGLGTKTQEVSNFFYFGQTCEMGPVLPSLTDLERVYRFWASLTDFEFLTRFHTLYTCWLVKSYDFTSQLMILTTMIRGIPSIRGTINDKSCKYLLILSRFISNQCPIPWDCSF